MITLPACKTSVPQCSKQDVKSNHRIIYAPVLNATIPQKNEFKRSTQEKKHFFLFTKLLCLVMLTLYFVSAYCTLNKVIYHQDEYRSNRTV